MRSLWRGAIAFGLVHIPIKVYAATEDRDVSFRQLHAACHTPVRYQKVCPTCRKELEADEIVRGYEHQRGQYVVVDDDALAALAEGGQKTVDVLHFVDLAEIDPVFFDRTYYLEPDAGGGRAYKLLQETLRRRKRIAMSRVVLRSRPRLAAIRVGPDGVLTMETLFYPDEIRSPQALLPAWVDKEVPDAELELALQLVDQRSVAFNPDHYRDTYREAVLAHVEERLADLPDRPAVAAAPAGKVIDLMEALKASLQQQAASPTNGDGSSPRPKAPATNGKGQAGNGQAGNGSVALADGTTEGQGTNDAAGAKKTKAKGTRKKATAGAAKGKATGSASPNGASKG